MVRSPPGKRYPLAQVRVPGSALTRETWNQRSSTLMRMSRPNSAETIGKDERRAKVDLERDASEPEEEKEGDAGGNTRITGGGEQDLGASSAAGHHDPGIRRLPVLDLISDFLGQALLVRGQWLIAERSAEDRHLEPGFVIHPGDAGRELQPPENPMIGVGVVTWDRIRRKTKRDGNMGFHRGARCGVAGRRHAALPARRCFPR